MKPSSSRAMAVQTLFLGHPPRGKATIPSTKSFLRLPGDGPYVGGGLFGASLQGRLPVRVRTQTGRLSGREPITPGGFDEHAPHVGIARLGDRPPLSAPSARMLAGHQADKGHELAWQVKAGEVPQFGQGRDGGERVHAAQAINPRVSPSRHHPSSVFCSAWSSPLIRAWASLTASTYS